MWLRMRIAAIFGQKVYDIVRKQAEKNRQKAAREDEEREKEIRILASREVGDIEGDCRALALKLASKGGGSQELCGPECVSRQEVEYEAWLRAAFVAMVRLNAAAIDAQVFEDSKQILITGKQRFWPVITVSVSP